MADRSIQELLRGVCLELESARRIDSASLARSRAKLAWIASLLPDQCPAPKRLLDLAAEVASAIGLDERMAGPDRRRLHATSAAASAVLEYLRDPASSSNQGRLADAGQQLLRASGRNPSAWIRSNVEWTTISPVATAEPGRLSLEPLRVARIRQTPA